MKRKSGAGPNSKGKGFEREVCVALSLWVTDGCKRDVFWRSAISGGRATAGARRGHDLARQAGDICAVAPEGNAFVEKYYVECKFYKKLRLDLLLLGGGPAATFWRRTKAEAARYGRAPMLVAKQNGGNPIVLTTDIETNARPAAAPDAVIRIDGDHVCVYLFETLFRVRKSRAASRRAA